MKSRIKELLENERISLTGVCALSDCKIYRPYLLQREDISDGSVIIFAIPYLSEGSLECNRNISAYASARDYHAYTKELFSRLGETLKKEFPENKFAFFADHSPIDERDAAVKCGIGFFGKNHLLISEEYSSYIFIAEIITDAILESDPPKKNLSCIGCGKCLSACPMNADSSLECLSAITQKKGELNQKEISLMQKYNTFWGCDICQEVCPHTRNAIKNGSIFTNIDFFKEYNTPHLSKDIISAMSDEEFSKRAYSWRGREVLLRNLEHSDASQGMKELK